MCSADDAKAAAAERRWRAMFDGACAPLEFIRIPDARSMAEGYNRGAARATGDGLLFVHDDVEVLNPKFPALAASSLARFDLTGIAGTTRLVSGGWISAGPPHVFGQVINPASSGASYIVCIFSQARRVVEGAQALDGCILLARRSAWEALRFDEATFRHFHLYDLDFAFRAHRAGLRVAGRCDWHVFHGSTGGFDDAWRTDAARFEAKHAGLLARSPARKQQFTAVEARSKAEAIEIMSPAWWGQDETV